jgi:hypothetical protein
MKKLIVTSVSALALLTLAACNDGTTDQTTTQSVPTTDGTGGNAASGTSGGAATGTGGATAEPSGSTNATPQDGPVNATTDNTTTQSIETETDVPESGTGGANQTDVDSNTLTQQPNAPASTAQ